MEKITKFLTNYRSLYNIFKKLPVIIFFVTVVLGFSVGIADCAGNFTELSWDAPVLSLLLFTLLGVVVGAINSLAYAIGLSPIVIIADANLKNLDEENKQ